MTTDELNVIIRAVGTSNFRSQMQQCTRSTLKFKASIVAIKVAVSKFTKSALQFASDLEEVQNVVEVVYGDMSNAVDKWSKTAAKNYGLSETIAKKYAGLYGAMSKSFDFATEDALTMGTTLAGLAGDVASFYNISVEDAYKKLKSVYSGETETLKDIGVVMTQTALDQYALAHGYGRTTKEMSEQEKVALRYRFILDKLSEANGDYQRTSHHWANMVRTAKLEIQSLSGEVGSELMPAAKIVFSSAVNGIKTVLAYIKTVASGISLITQGWVASSKSTKVFIAVSVGAAVALMNFNKIVAITKSVTLLASGAIKILNMNLLTTLTAAQALKGALGIVAVVAGVIGAVKLISGISKAFDNMEEKAKKPASSINEMALSSDNAAESVGNLSDATKEFSGAAEGIDRFLASFDEVNKINDNSGALGGLVTDDDLLNIDSAIDGIGNLQSEIDNLSLDNSSLDGLSFEGIADSANKFFKNISEKISRTKDLWNEMINADSFEKGLEAAEKIVGVWLGDDWVKLWDDAGAAMYDIWHEKNWKKKILILDKFIKDQFSGTQWYAFWNSSWGIVSDCWKLTYDAITGDIPGLMTDLDSLLTKLQNVYNYWKSFVTGDVKGQVLSMGGMMLGINFSKTNTPSSSASSSSSSSPSTSTTTSSSSPSSSASSSAKNAYNQTKKLSDDFIGPRKYAAGGFPNMGEMFIARESGPEMVGRIGNRTAVANNEQITTAIYNAVKSAMSETNRGNGSTVLYVDGKVLGKATVDYINNTTMSSGQSPLVEIG